MEAFRENFINLYRGYGRQVENVNPPIISRVADETESLEQDFITAIPVRRVEYLRNYDCDFTGNSRISRPAEKPATPPLTYWTFSPLHPSIRPGPYLTWYRITKLQMRSLRKRLRNTPGARRKS